MLASRPLRCLAGAKHLQNGHYVHAKSLGSGTFIGRRCIFVCNIFDGMRTEFATFALGLSFYIADHRKLRWNSDIWTFATKNFYRCNAQRDVNNWLMLSESFYLKIAYSDGVTKTLAGLRHYNSCSLWRYRRHRCMRSSGASIVAYRLVFVFACNIFSYSDWRLRALRISFIWLCGYQSHNVSMTGSASSGLELQCIRNCHIFLPLLYYPLHHNYCHH